jgi:FkbH-like protein/thioester reductase-like protein
MTSNITTVSSSQEKDIYNFAKICSFLQNQIAEAIKKNPSEVELSLSIEELALDSLNIVRLVGTLEELLNLELEPSLIYEYDSLESFCRQLEIMHQKQLQKEKDAVKAQLHINITASFTSEPVEESLLYWLDKLSFEAKIEFAPYNQIFQELLNINGKFYSNAGSINIILFRIEDWFRYEKAKLDEKLVRKTVNNFLGALKIASEQCNTPIILGFCPHSQSDVKRFGLGKILKDIDKEIYEYASKLKNIHVLELKGLNKDYKLRKVFDKARDEMGHIPFTQEYFTAIGTTLARKTLSLLQLPYKVIVLDCDQTLWDGVVGEDGHLGVKISSAFQFLQQHVVFQQEQGRLLCLCSKNNEADVWQVFDENPDMLLKKEQIVAHRINWLSKSQNIKELAAELQLGLDSFIFIDDNPAVCAEVQSELPEVVVINLPNKQKEIPDYLKHHWAFDIAQLSKEDKKRTQMYLENKQRQELRKDISIFEDFLAQLNIKIDIQPLKAEELSRASQLTQRTNQFNSTTIRRCEKNIQELLDSESSRMISVKVKDRFGDYGFVGLMIVQKEKNTLICESFLMSCRVLGRKVEHEMVRHLATFAKELDLKKVKLLYSPSERNQPLKDFYESFGREFVKVENNLFAVTFEPDNIEEILAKSKVEHQVKQTKQNSSIDTEVQVRLSNLDKGLVLNEIANYKGSVAKIIKSIRLQKKVKRPNLSTEFITPRTSWQKKIAAIWCDALGIDRIGIYDNFYDLGGDSLKAAEVFARMWDLGVSDSISIQAIPNPTVAGLSQAIEDVKAGRKPSLLMDEFSLEDEGKLPLEIIHQGYDIRNYDKPMERVFLTGGSGYIGAFLLSELFIQSQVSVICLVRANNKIEARNRIINNLKKYSLWKDEYEKRIDVILGDLGQPLFGLTQEEFDNLSQKIDSIFHSGAWVNFVYPYQFLKAANVFSVETVLRLAVNTKPKPIQVHFISTLGVIMSTGYERGVPIYEDRELEHCEELLNGYEQSKYVGDKMVWQAIKERGIPASMYRPGLVSGLSSSGVYHKLDEFLPSFLKGCIQLGSWPLIDTTWEMVPVDYVSKAIVHIALNPKNLGKAYFTLHPKSYTFQDFIQWHQNFGYPVRALPWDVWKREFLNQRTDILRENALFPFIDFIRAISEEQAYFPATDKSNFLNAIKDVKLKCPDQLVLLERYTRYFIDAGYYPVPPNNPEYNSKNSLIVVS